ncbi:MAG: HU family DNA-binding protein [Prevotella sp.]|nr:HU family DNA-binding protein [Prevotella sp.]
MAKTILQEIAARVAKKHNITIKSAESFVSQFFDVVKEGLDADKQVKVKGFGTFKVVTVKPRESINVRTGERVVIESHDKVNFTPDATMKELVNRPFSQFETVELKDDVDFEDIPHDEEPAIEEPVVEEPVVEEPAVEEPVADEPVAEETVAEEPVVEEAVSEEPTEEPAVEEPVVEERVAEEPVVEEAVVEKPTENLAVEEPVAEKPTEETKIIPLVASTPEEKPEETIATDVVGNSEKQQEENPVKKSNLWIKILAIVAVLALCFIIGRWLGQRMATSEEEPQAVAAVVDTTANDSIVTEEIQTKDGLDLEKLNSNPKITQGAYRIVGVENEVTLREGQTMESYCVRTLGGIAMLPYCQVLNDTTELGAGATMKIPKLELKSKSK